MYSSSPQPGALALRANLRANLARSRRKLAHRADMTRWDSCRRGLGDGSDAIPGMIPLFGAQKFDPQFAAPETPKQNGLLAFFETPIGNTDFTYGHVAAGFGGLALLVALTSRGRR